MPNHRSTQKFKLMSCYKFNAYQYFNTLLICGIVQSFSLKHEAVYSPPSPPPSLSLSFLKVVFIDLAHWPFMLFL